MNNLKYIYSEVVQGYSVSRNGLFVKHFGIKDESVLQAIYNKYFNLAIEEKKLKPEKESIEELIEKKLWTEEPKLLDIKEKLTSTRQALKLVKNIRDIVTIEDQIDKMEREKLELEHRRRNLLMSTAESFAFDKMNEYALEYAFFEDNKLSQRKFHNIGVEMDTDEFSELVRLYNETLAHINVDNLRKIAFSGILLNHIYLADTAFGFYGKPVVDLSYFQIDLFGYGLQYKNIVSNHGYPPEAIQGNADAILEWADSNNNKQELPSSQMTPNIARTLKEKGKVNFKDLVHANSNGQRIIV